MATVTAVPTTQTARFGAELRRLYENVESDDSWRDVRPRADVGAAARRLRAAVTDIDDDEPFRPDVPGDDLLVIPDRVESYVATSAPRIEAPLAVFEAEIEVVRTSGEPAPVPIVGVQRTAVEDAVPEAERRLAQRHAAFVERLRRHARRDDPADLRRGCAEEPAVVWEIRVATFNPVG